MLTYSRYFGLLTVAALGFAATSTTEAKTHRTDRTAQASNILWDEASTNMSGPTGGASILIRDRNEIWLEGHAKGLDAMFAYSVWLVVFNNPEHCVDGCGFDDIERRRVKPSIVWGSGFVSDTHGQGYFTAHLRQLDPLGEALSIPDTALHRHGLLPRRGKKAEIHFIIRCHGEVDPENVALQISTFGGGCESAPGGDCTDVQFGVHLP